MRAAILERNTDEEVLFQMKKRLFERMDRWAETVSCSGIVSKQHLIDVFYMEAAILTGCKLGADIPDTVSAVIDRTGAENMKRDFKMDTLLGFTCFLDGYEMRMR